MIAGNSKVEQPYVLVALLNYNDKNNLSEAIGSLQLQSYENFKIVIIDNDSEDGSVEFLYEFYPELEVISRKINDGYAGAYKKYLDFVFNEKRCDAVVLLNTDVIVEENWLLELVRSGFSDEIIAFAQSVVYLWQDGKTDYVNTSGNKINYLGFGYCGDYKKSAKEIDFKKDYETAYASGCGLLVKKEPYIKIGGLDQDFFSYLEDQDIGWRGWMYGYKSIVSVKSVMWHKYVFQGKSSSKKKYFLIERNRLFFLFKNYSLKAIIILFPVLLLLDVGVIMHAILNGYIIEKVKSYFSFFAVIFKMYKKRRAIQSKRIFSDSDLFFRLSPVIDFEELDSVVFRIANKFFLFYYFLVRRII